jgi:hypothetical protein
MLQNPVKKEVTVVATTKDLSAKAGKLLKEGACPPSSFYYSFQFTAMTNEGIEKFVEKAENRHKPVTIYFKTRNTITGLFVEGNDYEELKSKNFWRIVTSTNLEQWKATKNMGLARIFNGMEFTRLAESKE